MPRRILASAFALVTGLLASAGAGRALETLTVYDDALRSGFQDWSWATHDLASTAQVHGGTFAISFEPDGWEGVYFHASQPLAAADWTAARFWLHGGAAGGQSLTFSLQSGGTGLGAVDLGSYLPGAALSADTWVEVAIPLADLGVTSGSFDGVILSAGTAGDQPTVWVDDLILEGDPQPPPPLAVTVDATRDRRPVSPLLFGVSFADPAAFASVPYTANRWGGNATTRYNWRVDVANRASDWFFLNYPSFEPAPPLLPHGSAADLFVDDSLAAGAEPALTVPLIGWTPIEDRTVRWGMSIAKYGAQSVDECDWGGSNCDAGNGICTGGPGCTGGWIVGTDPTDTSQPIGSSFVTDWMAHLASRVGTAADGGVRFFHLDNEPMLWDSTHRDVHPAPVTYDELWAKTETTASAIKAQDPAAEIFGPALWGWCAYFTSAADAAADECLAGDDRAAHGGVALVPWYLDQVCAYQQAYGVRLVDWLDLHYYPQGDLVAGLDTDPGEDPDHAALRLRALRELWDPGWVSESWIGTTGLGMAVNLLPRMRQWVDDHCPGTKLALGEWRFGSDDGASSALAHAEALAIFAREGLDAAFRWTAPEPGTRTEDAFRLYLDYDGAGGRVAGDSVRATTNDFDRLGAYAVESGDGTLYLLLFHKDTAAAAVTVDLGSSPTGAAALYRFDAGTRLAAAGTVAAAGNALTLELPPRSATLAVVPLSGSPLFHDGFETGNAAAWSATVPPAP